MRESAGDFGGTIDAHLSQREFGARKRLGQRQPEVLPWSRCSSRLPPEIAAEIESIEQRLDELEEAAEDGWTGELMQEAAQLEERRDQLGETAEGLAIYAEKAA